ncbi:putative membrane protein [Campylobacter blaseri]|uniref:Uncharacterized protein n=1 Tax=Campylobacter blaseri TaxID=2042961 RepID=A0A2P8R3R3_9BACT|nr:hypothetical protein [Campylobacter blaseri]PSM53123.1 hypothetical protein CQ405_00805 [Campylobacter blaseri]PSM54589.1 hypothetical protein CRN67_00805 [Campylobacter blaseri]QKF86938.1 putative membrane protein [Campylobacter blaseri]
MIFLDFVINFYMSYIYLPLIKVIAYTVSIFGFSVYTEYFLSFFLLFYLTLTFLIWIFYRKDARIFTYWYHYFISLVPTLICVFSYEAFFMEEYPLCRVIDFISSSVFQQTKPEVFNLPSIILFAWIICILLIIGDNGRGSFTKLKKARD